MEAEKKVGEAEEVYETGDYQGSLEKLTQARALYASPALHFNLGLAYRGLGRDQDALDSFRRFVSETSAEDPALVARRREASWHIEALQARLHRAVLLTRPPAPPPAPAVAAVAPPPARPAPRLYRRWWFWTALGAVAAGAVTTAVLWRRSSPGPCAEVVCALGDFPLR